MKKLAPFVMAVSIAAIPTLASAWGQTGHRIGGEIADNYLSDEARSAIADILGPEDVAEASTWPDFMRSSPESFWRGDSRTWHYVTVPKGMTYDEVDVPDSGDAITALRDFQATLQSKDSSHEDKVIALRFAVHIIGDLHQPLHAGNGTDRGGNDFGVSWFNGSTNLHSVWDTKMVDHQKLSFSEYADWLERRITPEQETAWMVADPTVWVAESTELRDRIYPDEEGANLMWNYNFQHKADMDLRLTQSGVRMAAWLNETFAD